MSIFKKIELGHSKSQVSRWSKGFTLVELLVVIAIIGVLATLILLQLGTARSKARDAKRISDVSQIRTASELSFDDNSGRYPGPTPLCPGTGGYNTGCVVSASNNLSAYIASTNLPLDPLTNLGYGYAYNDATNRTQYQVWAELERTAPAAFAADADISGGAWPGNGAPGGNETCASATVSNDCVYDQGQR